MPPPQESKSGSVAFIIPDLMFKNIYEINFSFNNNLLLNKNFSGDDIKNVDFQIIFSLCYQECGSDPNNIIRNYYL